jgi:hypothetical protein
MSSGPLKRADLFVPDGPPNGRLDRMVQHSIGGANRHGEGRRTSGVGQEYRSTITSLRSRMVSVARGGRKVNF